jgi:hypothetical protein
VQQGVRLHGLVVGLFVEPHPVGLHGGAHGLAVGVHGGVLGLEPLGDHPGVEELAVRGAGHVVVERRRTPQRGRVDVAHHRAASGPPPKGDEALDLEQPQSLAERLAGHAVLPDHRRFMRQAVARRQTLAHDVADDVTRHALGGLQRPFDGRGGADGDATSRQPHGHCGPLDGSAVSLAGSPFGTGHR